MHTTMVTHQTKVSTNNIKKLITLGGGLSFYIFITDRRAIRVNEGERDAPKVSSQTQTKDVEVQGQ